jgi:hypothetical protein
MQPLLPGRPAQPLTGPFEQQPPRLAIPLPQVVAQTPKRNAAVIHAKIPKK